MEMRRENAPDGADGDGTKRESVDLQKLVNSYLRDSFLQSPSAESGHRSLLLEVPKRGSPEKKEPTQPESVHEEKEDDKTPVSPGKEEVLMEKDDEKEQKTDKIEPLPAEPDAKKSDQVETDSVDKVLHGEDLKDQTGESQDMEKETDQPDGKKLFAFSQDKSDPLESLWSAIGSPTANAGTNTEADEKGIDIPEGRLPMENQQIDESQVTEEKEQQPDILQDLVEQTQENDKEVAEQEKQSSPSESGSERVPSETCSTTSKDTETADEEKKKQEHGKSHDKEIEGTLGSDDESGITASETNDTEDEGKTKRSTASIDRGFQDIVEKHSRISQGSDKENQDAQDNSADQSKIKDVYTADNKGGDDGEETPLLDTNVAEPAAEPGKQKKKKKKKKPEMRDYKYQVLTPSDRLELEETGLTQDQIHQLDSKELEKLQLRLKTYVLDSYKPGPLQDGRGEKMNIVLLGQSGAGISSTGNTILGRSDEFEVSDSSTSQTRRVAIDNRNYKGRIVHVMDTPGFKNTRHVQLKKSDIKKYYSDKIDCFLYVYNASTHRHTEGADQATQSLKALFGAEVMYHTIVVFTHADIALRDKSLTELLDLEKPGTAMQSLISHDVNNRVIGVNNQAKSEIELEENRFRIVQMVEELVKENGVYNMRRQSGCKCVIL